MRKTKIVCTLGPSTDKDDVLEKIILEGMDVARFNFSHGSYEEHKKRLDKFISLREKHNIPVAALLDTKGPEIRTKKFKGEEVFLETGDTFTLKIGDEEGDKSFCCITYVDLYKDINVGDVILIDDGLIDMVVKQIDGTDIICLIQNGGKISNNKGINVPGVSLTLPYLSEKDISDIHFAIENNYDFIAASFTRSAKDILDIRNILEKNNGQDIKIIAKIENQDGINNIDEIIETSDGIMVARGDMGVEIPFEEIPILQKMIIDKTYKSGKYVITATQMLDSMMKNPRPTRAEVTDVSNAIYDGTTAIMLSGETAAGKFPVEAVRTMAKIAFRTEKSIDYNEQLKYRKSSLKVCITDAISYATCTTASDLNASCIITVTKAGKTPVSISKFRPASNIIACTMDEKTRRQLNLLWGVCPIVIDKKQDIDSIFEDAINSAKDNGYIKSGDVAVITAGVPVGISGTTNTLKAIHV